MQLRRTALWLMLASVLMLALYLLLPALASLLISVRLAGAGFGHSDIHISSFGLHGAVLDTARLEADDGSLRINMQGVVVDWSPAELFDGRVNSIAVARLSLTLLTGTGPDQPPVSMQAPAGLLAMIPARQLHVQQIAIKFPAQQPLQQISGRIDYAHGVLQTPLLLDTGTQQFQLQAEFTADGELHIVLEQAEPGSGSEIVRLSGSIIRQQALLQFHGELQADYVRLSPLVGEQISGRLDAELKLTWPAELPSDHDRLWSALAGHALLTTDLTAEHVGKASRINLAGTLTLAVADGRCDWHIDKGMHASAQLPAMQAPASLLLPTGLSGTVTIKEPRLLLVLPAGQQLRIGKLLYAGLNFPQTTLRLDQPLMVSYASTDSWQIEQAALSMPKQAMQWHGVKLGYQSITVARGENRAWRLRMHGATLSTGDAVVRAMDLNAELHVDQEKLSADYSLAAQSGLLQGSGRVEHNLISGGGSMRWHVPAMVFDSTHPLSEWLRLPQLDLDGGSISIDAGSRWQRSGSAYSLNHHIDAELDAIAGSLGESRFAGLSMHLQLTGSDTLKSSKPVRVALTSFDHGVAIRNIGATVGLELPLQGGRPVVSVDDLSAQLLGGQVTGHAIVMDLNRQRNPFTLSVEHLDIEQILALERQEGLSGNGMLDGTIPMLLTPKGVTVAQGHLSARAPGGVIRYATNATAQALAAGNSKMDMVLGIFRDFHYDEMDVLADYAIDGALKMQVRLAGKNPAYAAGRAVAFNLSLEENVLQLMKSLSVDSGVSKTLDQRVQQRLKK
ncbi:MAG: hypothetical protein COW18_06225 [Zetaproteobacteria bacterium CG12_big_fil_rev_8_21_14_0_65_54_13]|nr:MAG: hypothetical protein COW18_06225 [Zetaproteobacteria bacterium CG12_big_fil_rev_8_21_14_0_65_54_13]PIX55788.1 MAG: hypothetical protein COZ50_00910 [Zetaproteobacteria bacterium CG_4_10_14_3_um_filter_54_28]PJA27603.1 MAG: hypothetical protein CO188_12080 [Zetaproteobacteria bacterium CG_4_9_14_3_um_filter_54_145]